MYLAHHEPQNVITCYHDCQYTILCSVGTCRDSIKGVRALVASGSVEASPEAIASFLRQHNSSLDKEQLGEYLGHHDELEVNPYCCIPAEVCCQFKLLGGLVVLWDHFVLGSFCFESDNNDSQ